MPRPNDGVEVTLDRPRKLKFDFNAISTVEDMVDKPIMQLYEEAERGRFSSMRALLYALLLSDDPSLTLTQVGDLMNEHLERLTEIGEAMTRAVDQGMPSETGEPTGEVEGPLEGPTSNSSGQ